MELWLADAKQEMAAATHQTSAHINCAPHLRMMLEAALAAPSIAPTAAIKVCRSILPAMLALRQKIKSAAPIAIQMAPIARPIVVSGCLLLMRVATTAVKIDVPIIVTGHAKLLCPHVDHAMAT